jgi:membrane associated rhomboid family serine protease
MIFPTGDDTLPRSVPMVTIILVVGNVLVHIYMMLQMPSVPLTVSPDAASSLADMQAAWEQFRQFIEQYCVIPARYFSGQYGVVELAVPLFTSMFLHGDLIHLIGNMVFLWAFGNSVEDRMGPGRFLLFYLLCGLVASFAHIMVSSGSEAPALGASGAIAGILGGYILLFPEAKVNVAVRIPFTFFFGQVQISAMILLGCWFLLQLFYGLLSFAWDSDQSGGVAWWAHLYGFVAGLALVHLFKRKHKQPKKPDLWPMLYKQKDYPRRYYEE